MKYAVEIYATVRVRVKDVEASSTQEAADRAQEHVDLSKLIDRPKPSDSRVEHVLWDEGVPNFLLVDPLDESGEVIDGESETLDGEGNPLIDGKTVHERKAQAAEEASLFMRELLASVETLSGIADMHGVRTLADLMYLQGAILDRSCIDFYPSESAALDVVRGLPSGDRWEKFVRPVNDDDGHLVSDRPRS